MNRIFPSPLRLPVSLLLGLTLVLAGWELTGQLPVARWLAALLSPQARAQLDALWTHLRDAA